MANFEGFVRFDKPIRPKNNNKDKFGETIVKGNTSTPFEGSNSMRFKFQGRLNEMLMRKLSWEKAPYLRIKGWLAAREWQQVMEDGTTVEGCDCCVVVTEFEIISGHREPNEGIIVRKKSENHPNS